jgi:hypothetical protein
LEFEIVLVVDAWTAVWTFDILCQTPNVVLLSNPTLPNVSHCAEEGPLCNNTHPVSPSERSTSAFASIHSQIGDEYRDLFSMAAKADQPAIQVPFPSHSQRMLEYVDGATYLAIFERLLPDWSSRLSFFLV